MGCVCGYEGVWVCGCVGCVGRYEMRVGMCVILCVGCVCGYEAVCVWCVRV